MCSEKGCDKESVAKDLCAAHYQAERRERLGLRRERKTRHPEAVRVPVWLEPEENAALRRAVPVRGINTFIREAVRLKLAADAAAQGKVVRGRRA